MKKQHRGGFIDANGRRVGAGDRVQYRFGDRFGVLREALQDGDAYVDFDDTGKQELVKWINLAKVPRSRTSRKG